MGSENLVDEQGMNIIELFEEKQRVVIAMAKEIAEREFEILELNFMISSQITEQDSKITDDYVNSLRNKVNNGEIGLDEANAYIKCL